MPTKNSGLTCSACASAGVAGPVAQMDGVELRRAGLDERLAEEERQAGAEAHEGDADGDVVHLGQLADVAMERAEHEARAARGEHAEPRAAGEVGRRVGDHRAEHEIALEPEIDAAGFLGERLAQRDEHEGRRDADGAAEHGDEDGDDLIHQTRSPVLLGWKILNRP